MKEKTMSDNLDKMVTDISLQIAKAEQIEAEKKERRRREEILENFNTGAFAYDKTKFEQVLLQGYPPTYISCGGYKDHIGSQEVLKLAVKYGLSKDDATKLLSKVVNSDMSHDKYGYETANDNICKMEILIHLGHADTTECSISKLRELYDEPSFKADFGHWVETGEFERAIDGRGYDPVMRYVSDVEQLSFHEYARDAFILLMKNGYKPKSLSDQKDFIYLYEKIKPYLKREQERQREQERRQREQERQKQETRDNFEYLATKYYQAKNGYIYEIQVGKGDYDKIWHNPNEAEAIQLKQRLQNALEDGYQVDTSDGNSKSTWFIKELQEEQKTGKPYRRDDEYYVRLENGMAVGKCKVPLEFVVDKPIDFQITKKLEVPNSIKNVFRRAKGLIKGTFEKEGFTGEMVGSAGNISIKAQYKKGKLNGDYEERYESGGVIKAQYQEGKLHGVYKELNSDGTVHTQKYYENGVDVTEKRKALKKIAERHIAKEEKLSAKKGKPVILKKASKLEKALIAKKLKKSKEK